MQEIALIGFAQTLFFSLLLVTKRKKEVKDYLLVVFLLFVGAELMYRYLIITIPEQGNKWMSLFDIAYWALFGPVTLMYILFTINKVKKFRSVHFLHLIPLFIGFYAIKNFFFGDIEYASFIEYFNGSTGITKLALYFWEFCSPIYIICSLYILIIHKKSVKNYFSRISGKDIKWLTLLISGFIIYLIVFYIIWIIEDVFHIVIELNSLEVLPAILTAYVFVIGYYGYKQAGIFFDFPVNREGLRSKSFRAGNNKYIKSGLSDSERNELITRLRELMDNEKPFIDSDLNINTLAILLETSMHKLSQVINESFHQNFYDFINMYRVEEIKHLLKLPESKNYTIISIAYDCGFSSKSSFYNAFKKNTNLTPGEYLKRIDSLSSNVA